MAVNMGKTRDSDVVRLNRFLAEAGVASRRHAEELIVQGRVTVDGEVVTELAARVDAKRQKVAVDGEAVRPERKVYYLVNKPKGYVSTSAAQKGQPRVIDLLPKVPQRIYTVGRLDKSSEGLMLVTNDGELAQKLAHPRYGAEKTYLVQTAGRVTRADLERLRKGVWLDAGKVAPKRLRLRKSKGATTLLEITLTEGRNREIRRMLARLGHKVLNLRRIAMGRLRLAGLPVGHTRRLGPDEVRELRRRASHRPPQRRRR